MRQSKGFTLVELLVVIAIITLLAAIMFPVFAQAREKARAIACISNLKQIGMATMQYIQDYDETFYPHRFNCSPDGNPANLTTCPAYLDSAGNVLPDAAMLVSPDGVGHAEQRYFWVYMLEPYVKNYQVFACPSNPAAFVPGAKTALRCLEARACQGTGYGGQNSYGHNDIWMSPAMAYAGPGTSNVRVIKQASVPRVSSTALITDATYYGVAPDVCNQSGTFVNGNGGECTYASQFGTGTDQTGDNHQYENYWMNIGNASWCFRTPVTDLTNAMALIKSRHSEQINVQFTDGHAKSVPYSRLVSDVCLWTTDADGPHPNCN